MKETNKKKWLILVCVILAIAVLVVFFIYKKRFSYYEIKEKYSFSEIMNTDFTLSDKEKANINEFLDTRLVENDEIIGFKADVSCENLYMINSILELTDTINYDNVLKELDEKKSAIKSININNLDILNLLYYVNICNKLRIAYNIDDIYDCMEKYYDNESDLFYLNDKSDSKNIKIILTAMCCNNIPDIVSCNRFDIVSGVRDVYESYDFLTGKAATFYNSGGDILYCMSVLKLIDDSILERERDWFEYWKDYYESLDIKSNDAELAYVEFYKIAKIFEENYSNVKIQKYYENMQEDFENDIDLQMIKNIILYTETNKNEYMYNIIINRVDAAIENLEIGNSDISILETVYGVVLAKNSGYSLDYNKLKEYISELYQSIKQMQTPIEQVNYLYYTIILEQQINNYSISIGKDDIQQIIDEVLDELQYDTEIENDISCARKAIEIIMDLQIHGIDVHITKGQIDMIVDGMKKGLKNRDVMNSVIVTDMFILDMVLNTKLIDSGDLYNTYNKLTVNGGSKAAEEGGYIPDIYSTYRFFVCFDLFGEYKYLSEQKLFVESIKKDDGIYEYDGLNGYSNIESVLYGNCIYKTEIGGDK